MARATEDATMLSNVRGDSNYLTGMPTSQAQTPRADAKLPPIGNFAPPSVGKENKKRRGGAGSQITGGAAGPMSTESVSTIGKHGRLDAVQSGNVSKVRYNFKQKSLRCTLVCFGILRYSLVQLAILVSRYPPATRT